MFNFTVTLKHEHLPPVKQVPIVQSGHSIFDKMTVLNIGNEDMYIGLVIGFGVMIGIFIVLCIAWRCCCKRTIYINEEITVPPTSDKWADDKNKRNVWNSEKENYYNNLQNGMIIEGGKVKMDEAQFLQKYI